MDQNRLRELAGLEPVTEMFTTKGKFKNTVHSEETIEDMSQALSQAGSMIQEAQEAMHAEDGERFQQAMAQVQQAIERVQGIAEGRINRIPSREQQMER